CRARRKAAPVPPEWLPGGRPTASVGSVHAPSSLLSKPHSLEYNQSVLLSRHAGVVYRVQLKWSGYWLPCVPHPPAPSLRAAWGKGSRSAASLPSPTPRLVNVSFWYMLGARSHAAQIAQMFHYDIIEIATVPPGLPRTRGQRHR